jgi:hypothetical protein
MVMKGFEPSTTQCGARWRLLRFVLTSTTCYKILFWGSKSRSPGLLLSPSSLDSSSVFPLAPFGPHPYNIVCRHSVISAFPVSLSFRSFRSTLCLVVRVLKPTGRHISERLDTSRQAHLFCVTIHDCISPRHVLYPICIS